MTQDGFRLGGYWTLGFGLEWSCVGVWFLLLLFFFGAGVAHEAVDRDFV